jgi:hypothetical protein
MRLCTLSLIALLGMTTVAVAFDPYPFQRSDGKWGYVDDEHCWVIEPQFYYAAAFSEGLAYVQAELGVAYVQMSGGFAINPPISNRVTNAGSFHEGLAKANYFTEGGVKWGFIDNSGNFVIRPVFDAAEDFSDGMAVVSMKKEGSLINLKGYVASDGSLIHAPQYLIATRFTNGLAAMGNIGKVGFIDKSGEYVIPPIF